MTCEKRRPTSHRQDEDEPMITRFDESPSAAALGGWRPASFAAPSLPAVKAPIEVPAAARHPAHAFLTSEPIAAAIHPASSPDGSKGGLAGLFSSRPQPRTLRLVDETTDNSGPRVETDRLVLRVLGLQDFDDYFAVAADPETFRYSHRGGMSSDEAWTRLLRQVGHWSLLGWGMFAIEEKATGRFVGECGLGDFRRGLGADFDGIPEAGCTIAPWAQRSGYATEAMQGALDWIEGKLDPARTVCLVHHENKASIRVAEKLGYRRFAVRSYRGFEAVLFERLRGASIAAAA